ncbi:hypothetical protein N431DRAFT_436072 [Stipitochalara longipes BDJ]|nr:hypothetical protein N431DRAFT_436072 [Stipitochalara longipes BDJ]
MSNEAAPISPARFAAALKDLPLSTLHLKAMEIRNSIAHLDYSNEQLKPFADGTDSSSNGQPDQDCIDAIKENEIVIARMQERIALLKTEVEARGSSWLEFQSAEELQEGDEPLVNGTRESDGDVNMEGHERSDAWRDGTFQTGRIVNGEVTMDGATHGSAANGGANNAGGRLDDEALRRAMEERLRTLSDEGNEGGMHL